MVSERPLPPSRLQMGRGRLGAPELSGWMFECQTSQCKVRSGNWASRLAFMCCHSSVVVSCVGAAYASCTVLACMSESMSQLVLRRTEEPLQRARENTDVDGLRFKWLFHPSNSCTHALMPHVYVHPDSPFLSIGSIIDRHESVSNSNPELTALLEDLHRYKAYTHTHTETTAREPHTRLQCLTNYEAPAFRPQNPTSQNLNFSATDSTPLLPLLSRSCPNFNVTEACP